MPEQSFLPGFEAAPRPTDRLFFAIYPDVAAAAQIAQLAQQLRAEHGLQGKPLKAERFHVTLHHLGDYAGLPQDLVAVACGAAASVAAAPFDITFDRAASFTSAPRNRPFVLRGDGGLAALIAFQQSLGDALKKNRARPLGQTGLHTPCDASLRRSQRSRAGRAADFLDRARVCSRAQPDRPDFACAPGALAVARQSLLSARLFVGYFSLCICHPNSRVIARRPRR